MEEPRKVEMPAAPGMEAPVDDDTKKKYASGTPVDDHQGRIKELEGALSRAIQHMSDETHRSIDELRVLFHPDHAPKTNPTVNANQQVKK